jgi:hypothetical protein
MCKCPICGEDARTIDKRAEADANLVSCDANETYRCYQDKDNDKLRFVQRKTRTTEINWEHVL